MELRSINRDYPTLKFWFKSDYSHKNYEDLCKNEEYLKMKEIFIPYSEKKLHVITSYIFLFKWLLPMISSLLIVLSFDFNEVNLFNIGSVLFLFSFVIYLFLIKRRKIVTQIYSFEITAINDEMYNKFGFKIDNDFNILGEKYINNEL